MAETPPNEMFDIVLVGGGSASCLLASRLSQSLPNHQILILEAGRHIQNDPKIQIPGLSTALQSDPTYDWQYVTAPEAGLNCRRMKHPRGKLVGGTSAINSHSVVFPNCEWQDRIAEELLPDDGRAEWKSDAMRDCYDRWQSVVTKSEDDNDPKHQDRVRVSHLPSLDFLQAHWLKVFEELGHDTQVTDFTESSVGAVSITNAIDSSKGERSHAATAFFEPAVRRGNVTLKTGVKVDKIAFDTARDADGRLHANGIYYNDQGTQHLICAKKVVLCAGTFESPAILERSGIGSRQILEAANVPVLYELSGVGENLQDHLNCSLSAEVNDDVPTRDEVIRDPELQKASRLEYEQSHTGRLADGPAYSFAFTPLQMLESTSETQEFLDEVKKLVETESNPSFKAQYRIIQKAIESPTEATATTFMLRCQRNRDLDSFPPGTPSMVDGNYVTVVAMLAHPFSRGSCHITSDTSQYPEIKFNYLSHALDTEIFARHMRLNERLFQTPAFTAILKPDGRRLPRSFPHPINSLDDARGILAINSATNYHPSSTCSMMREDLNGVVDAELRVYGTKNVRVCDASVIPIIPRGNILATVYAYAEKAAEIIIREVEGSVA